jgi:molybdopterin synthase catalytic subunit
VLQAPDGPDWLALTGEPLPVDAAARWAGRPDCGAIVTFTGTVRDHAEGRADVSRLEYEAYAEAVAPRLEALAAEARASWPTLGRIACLHRIGVLEVGEPAVVVAVSAPHRSEAFEAARWCIDTLKETVPIWKRETWRDGEDWGGGAKTVTEVGS